MIFDFLLLHPWGLFMPHMSRRGINLSGENGIRENRGQVINVNGGPDKGAVQGGCLFTCVWRVLPGAGQVTFSMLLRAMWVKVDRLLMLEDATRLGETCKPRQGGRRTALGEQVTPGSSDPPRPCLTSAGCLHADD